MSKQPPFVVGITGASGAAYSVRLLDVLTSLGYDIDLAISPSAQLVLKQELDLEVDLENFDVHQLGIGVARTDVAKNFADRATSNGQQPMPAGVGKITYHHYRDFMAPIASGSALSGGDGDLPVLRRDLEFRSDGRQRQFDSSSGGCAPQGGTGDWCWCLEKTPLSLVHLENMRRAAEVGATILPASPGWYHGVNSLQDLVDFIVARILDQLGIPNELMERWGSQKIVGPNNFLSSQNVSIMIRPYLELVRFSHTLFALPFALLAAVMAWTVPPLPESLGDTPIFAWRTLLGILLCMVFARSAAMAFNRLVDRRFDATNPRTKNRHLVTGALSPLGVFFFTAASAIGFVASTLLFFPNHLPILLSVPFLAVLLMYSLTKRVTAMAHVWLGLSLMLAPISAWIAIRGELVRENFLDLQPMLFLGSAVLLWVTGFDIIYACQDVEHDRRERLRSVPAWLGIPGALRFAALCHGLMVCALAMLPIFCPRVDLGWLYLMGVLGVAVLLIYEHRLVRPDDLERVNVAFFNVNVLVSMGLLLVVAVELIW